MSLGNRYSQHSFSQVPQANIMRSKFDRSFQAKDTMDFDQLVPFFVDEIVPGDTVNLTVNHFIRLATQVVPVLDNMYLDFFFFFVPNRLVWENFERFMGYQPTPGASTDFLVLQVSTTLELENSSLMDHYGLVPDVTPGVGNPLEFNALIPRGYNLIWNEWFRDQNLNNPVNVPLGDGPDAITNYGLLGFAKKHDYFTSMLPWPQKGDAVTLSLASSAPVISDNTPIQVRGVTNNTDRNVFVNTSSVLSYNGTAINPAEQAKFGTNTGLEADLTEASAVTINQLRLAIMTQSLLELDARGGTRYVEILKSHFNVVSPDFRLQRPEFLSSSTIRLNQHPVAQTSETGTTPQANLAAYTTSSNMGNNVGFTKSFVEHGYVHGFVRARADVTYQQGINKMWLRQTRYDFFWPKLQELGEQAVSYKELCYTGNALTDNSVLGYIPRYDEYRYYPSQIRGQFRSSFAQSLDVWHLAQELVTPNLNAEFIRSETPIERVLAVEEGYPDLLCDYWFNYKHARPMVTHAIPATLGRF